MMTAVGVSEIAQELIVRAVPLDNRHAQLFKKEGPLGPRWSLDSGTKNLDPFKILRRKVYFGGVHDASDDAIRRWSYFSNIFGNKNNPKAPVEIATIFDDSLSVRLGVESGLTDNSRILRINLSGELAVEPPTSRDIGRMMLIDTFLAEQQCAIGPNITPDSAMIARRIILG